MSKKKNFSSIAILFSGGPAPSANAVISSLTLSLLNERIKPIGIIRGFEFLEDFDLNNPYSLIEGVHYKYLDYSVSGMRNKKGVLLKTSRANPGKDIKNLDDLKDPEKNKRLMNIIAALKYLRADALITIGGDDTLKTANYLRHLGGKVIHIPKTIDNDYYGIPWTFGYWTAVEEMSKILLNLRADAEATDSYFVVELMGRKAGWLTYAAGIAGEAVKMISLEDIEKGKELDIDGIVDELSEIIIQRERDFKNYGVFCIAEGLAEILPEKLRPKETDKHGNIIYGKAEIGRIIARATEKAYHKKMGRKKKIVYKQVGYETRSGSPVSFDVVLGSMLGYGAFKLMQANKFGHMVSVDENFNIKAIPFDELIDDKTLLTKLRNVPQGSDFYELKESLSYRPLIK